MEQKLSDTLVKAIDRSNPFIQNLQLASRFNKLIEEGGGDLEDNKEISITENGTVEITPAEGKGGMKKVTATVNVSSGGGNTYAHKVEIKFDNFSLSYYGQEGNHSILGFSFNDIANNSIGRDGVSLSGDLQELLNLYTIMLSPYSGDPFTKESKIAYHMYLKDADTENLVEGIGMTGSTYEDNRGIGILFNSGTQDKYFTNTIVLEWN